MSRSGYTDDYEYMDLYRQAVKQAINGQRGQALLRDLLNALDSMPEKILIAGELETLDPDDPATVAQVFGIATSLAAEIVFVNDEEGGYDETPEGRWHRVRAWVVRHIVDTSPSVPAV